MYKPFLLGYLLCLFSLSLIGQEKETAINPNDSQTAWDTLSGDGFAIQHPWDWNVDTSGMMGTSFYLFNTITADVRPFRENVNLIIQDLSAYQMNLDQFIKLSESQLSNFIKDATILSNERIEGEPHAYQKLIYTGTVESFNLKFEQYIWVIDHQAYILTMTCEIGQFDAFQEIGEAVMNSFVFSSN